jgi:hypothetical protein
VGKHCFSTRILIALSAQQTPLSKHCRLQGEEECQDAANAPTEDVCIDTQILCNASISRLLGHSIAKLLQSADKNGQDGLTAHVQSVPRLHESCFEMLHEVGTGGFGRVRFGIA